MTTAAVVTVLFVTTYKVLKICWLRAPDFGPQLTGDDGCLSAHLDRDLDLITHTGIAVLLASSINIKDASIIVALV